VSRCDPSSLRCAEPAEVSRCDPSSLRCAEPAEVSRCRPSTFDLTFNYYSFFLGSPSGAATQYLTGQAYRYYL
jgi:hypothetical protein